MSDVRRLQRLPDRTISDVCGTPITLLSWAAIWPAAEAPWQPATTCEAIQKALTLPTDPRRASSPESVAASLAIRLQSGVFPEEERWLRERHHDNGFAYPFVDDLLAVESGRLAFSIVHEALLRAVSGAPIDLEALARNFETARAQVASAAPPSGLRRVLLEAVRRGIPLRRTMLNLPLYQLGHGQHARRLMRLYSDATGHMGTLLATHKQLTNRLLGEQGLPVPRQAVAADLDTAHRAARAFGWPVVVKPSSTDRGIAVTTGIRDAEELERAFSFAQRHGRVLIEQHIEGDDFRLLVVDGCCIGVTTRVPAQIVGDGHASVAELIGRMSIARQADPFLRDFPAATLDEPIVVETLSRQGLNADSVPDAGRTVLLRTNANVSTGGSHRIVTDITHPDNLRLAERAARCVGLDIAGVDFLTPDIGRSWRHGNGAICEVNPTPAMSTPDSHIRIVDVLFPRGSVGRVPIIVLIADASPETRNVWQTIIDRLGSGRQGLATITDGTLSIDGQFMTAGRSPLYALARIALSDKLVQALVIHAEAAEFAKGPPNGGHCDLAVVIGGNAAASYLLDATDRPVITATRLLTDPGRDALREALDSLDS